MNKKKKLELTRVCKSWEIWVGVLMLFLIVLSRSFFDILGEQRFTFMVKRVFVTEMKPDTGQVTFCEH